MLYESDISSDRQQCKSHSFWDGRLCCNSLFPALTVEATKIKRWIRSLLCSQVCLTEETKAPLTCLSSALGWNRPFCLKKTWHWHTAVTKRVMKVPLLPQVSTWWLLGLPTGLQDNLYLWGHLSQEAKTVVLSNRGTNHSG